MRVKLFGQSQLLVVDRVRSLLQLQSLIWFGLFRVPIFKKKQKHKSSNEQRMDMRSDKKQTEASIVIPVQPYMSTFALLSLCALFIPGENGWLVGMSY